VIQVEQSTSLFYFDRRFNELEEQHALIRRDLRSLHDEHEQILLNISELKKEEYRFEYSVGPVTNKPIKKG
jgi:hypothetical protein